MKCVGVILVWILLSSSVACAQNNELLLAKQFAANGEQQKALDLFQKLFKQDNETYFNDYFNNLLVFKKFDEATSISKKMIRKHPADHQYIFWLGSVYTQQGLNEKAEILYDDLIKNLPSDQNEISLLASLFYRNSNIEYSIKVFKQGRIVLRNEHLFTY